MDSIRSHGSADGSNTEGTERLHIDLAKMGYQAGNKRDYIKFMTVWLRRQEAIHQQCIYLQWAIPGYMAPMIDGDAEEEDSAGDGQGMGGADEPDDEVVASDEGLTYHLAKKPAFVGASAQSITSDYGAISFVDHFNDYLGRAYPAARWLQQPLQHFLSTKRLCSNCLLFMKSRKTAFKTLYMPPSRRAPR